MAVRIAVSPSCICIAGLVLVTCSGPDADVGHRLVVVAQHLRVADLVFTIPKRGLGIGLAPSRCQAAITALPASSFAWRIAREALLEEGQDDHHVVRDRSNSV